MKDIVTYFSNKWNITRDSYQVEKIQEMWWIEQTKLRAVDITRPRSYLNNLFNGKIALKDIKTMQRSIGKIGQRKFSRIGMPYNIISSKVAGLGSLLRAVSNPHICMRNQRVFLSPIIPMDVMILLLNMFIPPLLLGFSIWLTGVHDHSTTLHHPLFLPVSQQNLMQAIYDMHDPSMDQIQHMNVGENVTEGEEVLPRHSTRAISVATLVASSVLGIVITFNALYMKA